MRTEVTSIEKREAMHSDAGLCPRYPISFSRSSVLNPVSSVTSPVSFVFREGSDEA